MEPVQREQVEIHAPPDGLRGPVACVILRRVGSAPQPLAARVHANTFACLNALAGGTIRCDGVPQAACFLVGPSSRPRDTEAQGEVLSASLVLQPWTLEPWFGLRADALADTLQDMVTPRDAHLQRLRDALLHACSGPDALQPLWDALAALASERPASAPVLALDVLRRCGVAAAAQAAGCSERQYRRRFQRNLGLGPAAWLRVRRWEAALQDLLAPGAALSIADLAAGHDYADQAHLARETRSFVRDTPGRLRGSADWPLLPARVRTLQDGEEGSP
jgi:AraC-like DNA-binding protein